MELVKSEKNNNLQIIKVMFCGGIVLVLDKNNILISLQFLMYIKHEKI